MIGKNPYFIETESLQHVPKHLNVLMVEDDELNRVLARQVVKKIGWNLDTAKNGIEAFEKLKQSKYDLVLMDIQMPQMDGIEATLRIRSELKSYSETPIIACASDTHDLNKWLEAGMNDHLPKPFGPAELIAKVADLIKRSANNVYRKKETPMTGSNLNDEAVINLHNLYNFSGNNADTVKNIIEVFLQQAPEQMKGLTSLMAQKDWAATKILCHKMKSSYAIIGATSVRSILQTIEDECVKNRIDEVKFKELLDKAVTLNEAVIKRIRIIAGL
jgi:CheY-like chemotaxis protein